MSSSRRLVLKVATLLTGAVMLPVLVNTSFAQSSTVGKSGHPIPRFVSLKSQKVNMRRGPGTEFKVDWRYEKRGLPMEIIQESDNWRKVRDAEGNEGWILHSLLSGKRTAIINPWESDKQKGLAKLFNDASDGSRLKAQMEPGVVVDVEGCEENWCHVTAKNVTGYVQKKHVWGVYPDELIEE